MHQGSIAFEGCLRSLAVAAAFFSWTPIALGSDNPVNDALLKKPAHEQKEILQEVVGDGCRATRVFFNGIAKRGPAKGRAFWSVACADGRTFMVMIPPNVDDTRVIECRRLKALGIRDCFKKL